jgi:hypothetical protein
MLRNLYSFDSKTAKATQSFVLLLVVMVDQTLAKEEVGAGDVIVLSVVAAASTVSLFLTDLPFRPFVVAFLLLPDGAAALLRFGGIAVYVRDGPRGGLRLFPFAFMATTVK